MPYKLSYGDSIIVSPNRENPNRPSLIDTQVRGQIVYLVQLLLLVNLKNQSTLEVIEFVIKHKLITESTAYMPPSLYPNNNPPDDPPHDPNLDITLFNHAMRNRIRKGLKERLVDAVPLGWERDPPEPRESLRQRGARLSQWISDAGAPECPIRQRVMSVEELLHYAPDMELSENCTLLYGMIMQDLLLPAEAERPGPSDFSYEFLTFSEETYRHLQLDENALNVWSGYVAPNLIAINDVQRSTRRYFPYASEIGLALYNSFYGSLDGLRYIFVNDVRNPQTHQYITKDLMEVWPIAQPQTFDYGTQEYEEILGTRMGRIVAYMVLGAFVRGSHRITQVTVYCSDRIREKLDLRFDIDALVSEN